MKIHTLIENTSARPELAAEHGLSLYIETQGLHILFDTGKSGAFADNAEKMGVDLRRADLCILSHGHYDHGGGLSRFLQINPSAPVYTAPGAFSPCYSSGSYIGLDPALQSHPRILEAGDPFPIAPGITLCTCNRRSRPWQFGVFGQSILQGGIQVPETYEHEQYLLIEEKGKRICISGCSHKGVLNILHWLQPDFFVGGFHFIRMDPQGAALAEAGRQLEAFPARYYTGHCTGQTQYAMLKARLGDRLEYLSAGTVLEL